MSKSFSTEFDVHQEITNRIVAAIESAGEFQLPWITNSSGSFARPVNIASKKPFISPHIPSACLNVNIYSFLFDATNESL